MTQVSNRTEDIKLQRAALYIRVSTDEQALHGDSLSTQRELLTAYAKSNSMEIVGCYVDDGYTASKLNRPALQRMLNDVRLDKIDIILFTKLDRWFRSVRDYYKIQEVIETHHVNWKTILENYDTTTSSGRLHINIMLSVAEDEVSRTSERIKVVFESKVRRGEAINGNFPIGFKVENKRVVHDEKAPIARALFLHYELHRSKHATIRYARDEFGLRISECTMSKMLCNPLYKGEYRGIIDYCEPIIEPERFSKIQEIIKSNIRKAPSSRIYIFSGLLVCSECGHKMISRAQHSGKFYYYYRCNHYYKEHLCNHKGVVSEAKIEKYLLDNIEQEIRSVIVNYEISSKQRSRKPAPDKGKIRRKLERLKELYINDLISLEDYKKDYADLKQQLDTLVETTPPPVDINALKHFLSSGFLAIYQTLDREERRLMWRSVIKEIHLDSSNSIRIFFV